MRQNLSNRSNNFPARGSEFIWASEGPQNGGKMTGMDILEFRDINSLALMPKYGEIWSNRRWGWIPPHIGIFRVNE